MLVRDQRDRSLLKHRVVQKRQHRRRTAGLTGAQIGAPLVSAEGSPVLAVLLAPIAIIGWQLAALGYSPCQQLCQGIWLVGRWMTTPVQRVHGEAVEVCQMLSAACSW